VERAEDVRPAIERAFAHPGPAVVDFVTDPRALSMPPQTTIAQVRGMALAMTKLVFAGDSAEVVETLKSNVRNIPQAL
jgi:pyruvate dehydrogenase (quinone)